MGNCQAAQVAAAVVVQHPGKDGKVDKMYWPINANEVMRSNPGHYVALVVESPNVSGNVAVKHQLKLLRPTDILHVGHVYRLITSQDVIKEFATKSVKLGKLLKESGALTVDKGSSDKLDQTQIKQDGNETESSISRSGGSSRRVGRHRIMVAGSIGSLPCRALLKLGVNSPFLPFPISL